VAADAELDVFVAHVAIQHLPMMRVAHLDLGVLGVAEPTDRLVTSFWQEAIDDRPTVGREQRAEKHEVGEPLGPPRRNDRHGRTAEGVPDQHRPLEAARVEVGERGLHASLEGDLLHWRGTAPPTRKIDGDGRARQKRYEPLPAASVVEATVNENEAVSTHGSSSLSHAKSHSGDSIGHR